MLESESKEQVYKLTTIPIREDLKSLRNVALYAILVVTALATLSSAFQEAASWFVSPWKASIASDGDWCENVYTDGPDFVADYGICADGSNGLGFAFKGTNGHLESLPITPCEVDSHANIHCPAYVDVSFDGGDFNMLEGDGSGTHVAFKPKLFNRVLEAKRITFRYTNKDGQNRTVIFHVAGFPPDKREELQRKKLID